MRLIDADELIKNIDYSADLGGALGKVVECVKYYAKFMVASAPTIERKTGEWEEREVSSDKVIDEWQSARCSVCGKYHTTPYMYFFDDFNFCPNCGARMER